LGITNRPESSLAQIVDQIIETHAGLKLELLQQNLCRSVDGILLLSDRFSLSASTCFPTRIEQILTGLRQLPAQIELILESQERYIEQLTHEFAETQDFIFVGRGINFPIALEEH
jgi:glucosamine--fructose-6-phosphate aminotransferase (isomerizing)